MSDIKDAEKMLEKLPRPPVWFLRLQKDTSESKLPKQEFVYEIQEHESWFGQYRFYRAEARLLWREYQSGVTADLRQFHRFENAIQVVVDTEGSTAMFGPTSQIGMSERGIGLGSALMSKVIQWLKTEYPDAEVRAGTLAAPQAGADNKARRNRFYESHGFDVEYYDTEQKSGSFKKKRAGDLYDKPIKGTIMCLDDIIELYDDEHQKAEKQNNILILMNKRVKELSNHISIMKCIIILLIVTIIIIVSYKKYLHPILHYQ
ncbi:MAG: hypothetical protein ABF739_08290 [Acetobacter okinawensis]|uniref:hypothetical protein n=1 Tax=Acetobacter okinawensis TaxID=1076594 RepID=UPI0039E9EC5C